MANLHRGKDTPPYPLQKFHPYWKRSKQDGLKLSSDNIADLKPAFHTQMVLRPDGSIVSIT